MFQYIDPVTDLRSSMLRVLVAALLGGLIGVERERSHGEQKEEGFAGARTFPLFAILVLRKRKRPGRENAARGQAF